ncbi:hypothetical protein QBC36DRAFT_198046 [Triangularia setosa]|uniref:F-box domain-containing protein n=1 Tax=Triangularia setosa TaxID=2587417 RepID=A0AAN6VYB7_9PEZI|nr:hypothetical protein QBC36DRAFT_198046 [Podospora setosa]
MVHLLDLPDELLIQICEGLQQIDKYSGDNCRLACQQLCAASSHLLVPVVAVDCRVASLERFSEIIRHPVIGKGVRTVRVPMHSYRCELSEVRTSFVKFIAEPAIHDLADPELYLDNTCEPNTKMCEWLGRLLPGRVPQGEHVKHDDRVWSRALSLVHGEYQRLFREQELLRRDGNFVNTIASALAKIPHRTVLVFDDKPCKSLDVVNLEPFAQKHCHLLDLDPDFWRSMWYDMLSPYTWTGLVNDDFGWESFAPDPAFEEPRMDFVFNLPSAIARAGGRIHHIQFHSDCDRPLGHIPPGTTTQSDFASAMQQLEAFTVITQQPPEDSIVDDLASSVLANASNLYFLRIAFTYANILSKALASRPLPHLRQIHFDGAQIKVPDLVVLLDGLPAHVDAIYLGHIRLVEGTWAEALDALRKKSYGSFVIEKPEGLLGPGYTQWAFDPMGNTIASEAPEERFLTNRRVPGSLSPAEAFVLRITSINPCRT